MCILYYLFTLQCAIAHLKTMYIFLYNDGLGLSFSLLLDIQLQMPSKNKTKFTSEQASFILLSGSSLARLCSHFPYLWFFILCGTAGIFEEVPFWSFFLFPFLPASLIWYLNPNPYLEDLGYFYLRERTSYMSPFVLVPGGGETCCLLETAATANSLWKGIFKACTA